ncbi:hypothetical protein JCM10207_002079 [Rhodosporidiobolus poonsookiae]
MLFRNWDRFTQACEDLTEHGQKQTRACLRWRHEAGLLVIRVTDDHKTLTFKARSSVYLNRFDLLNRALLAKYQNRRRPTVSPAQTMQTVREATAGVGADGAAAGGAAEVQSEAAGGAGQGGEGGGKKKKKKGKKGGK